MHDKYSDKAALMSFHDSDVVFVSWPLLLPCRKLATYKWKALDEKYTPGHVNPPAKETPEKIVTILESDNLNGQYYF